MAAFYSRKWCTECLLWPHYDTWHLHDVLITSIIRIAIVIVHSLHCQQRLWRQHTRDIRRAAWRAFASHGAQSELRDSVTHQAVLSPPRARPLCLPRKRARLTCAAAKWGQADSLVSLHFRLLIYFHWSAWIKYSGIYHARATCLQGNSMAGLYMHANTQLRVLKHSAWGRLWSVWLPRQVSQQNPWLIFIVEICLKVKIMSEPINLLSRRTAAEVGVAKSDLQIGTCLMTLIFLISSPRLFLPSLIQSHAFFCDAVAHLHQQSHKSTKELETQSRNSSSSFSVAGSMDDHIMWCLTHSSHLSCRVRPAADPAHSWILL